MRTAHAKDHAHPGRIHAQTLQYSEIDDVACALGDEQANGLLAGVTYLTQEE